MASTLTITPPTLLEGPEVLLVLILGAIRGGNILMLVQEL
jgi:hypothetical protein